VGSAVALVGMVLLGAGVDDGHRAHFCALPFEVGDRGAEIVGSHHVLPETGDSP